MLIFVTVAALSACGADGTPPPEVTSGSSGSSSTGIDPYFQSLMGEAVVRAHGVEVGDEYDVVGTVRRESTIVLDDVLLLGDVDQDGTVPVPKIDPGSLDVFEVIGFASEEEGTEALAAAPEDGFVAVLDFSAAHPDALDRSPWNVAAVAGVNESGELRFTGRQQHVQHFFDVARTAFVPDPYGSDAELLVGIAEEAPHHIHDRR